MKKNPYLTIDFGPMFSEKSQEIHRRCAKIADAIANVHAVKEEMVDIVILIVFKDQISRKAESVSRGFTTHASNFTTSKYLKIREVERLAEITEEELSHAKYIGIDEAFYPDLYEKVIDWFINRRISISIACIDGSAQQHILCPQILQILPYATKIVKHSAYCHFCLLENKEENAFYTIQYQSEKNKDGDIENKENGEIELGGADKYRPVCLNHLIWWRNK